MNKNYLQTIAFVLASTKHGTMLVNRFDEQYLKEENGYRGVGSELLGKSYFSLEEIEFVSELLKYRKENFGEGVVLLDCGANIGTHTIPWSHVMYGWGEVIAVEAQERLFYALAGNITLNNCFNARALFAAIGSSEGEILIPNPNYFLNSSFGSLELIKKNNNESIGQALDYSADNCVAVRMVTVDQFQFKRLDFIKLDIEGMELEALLGAHNTLKNLKPNLLIERIKSSKNKLFPILQKFNYVTYAYDSHFLALHAEDPVNKKITLKKLSYN